jgi:hypothetical protein
MEPFFLDNRSLKKNPGTGFSPEIGDRFFRKDRGSIWKNISGSGFFPEKAIRFFQKNRRSILCSVCGFSFIMIF